MTVPSYTHDLADIDLAQAVGSWAESSHVDWDDGGAATADADYPFIQGTVAISQQVTKATIASLLVSTGGTTLPTDGAYLIWQVFASAGSADTFGNGGLRVMVGSALDVFYWWSVGGSNFGRYPYGGWMNHAVNTTVTAGRTAVGSPTGTESYVGAAVRSLQAIGKGNPHAVDAVRYGRCSSIFQYGSDGDGYCTFTGFATKNDYNDAVNGYNRWGLIQAIAGGFLFKGKMTLGSTNACDFRDSNKSILVDNTPAVTSGFNRIEVNNVDSKVYWTNINITALGTVSRGNFEVVDDADVQKTGCVFTDMGTFIYQSLSVLVATTWRRCNLITTGGASLTGCIIEASNDAAKALIVASPAEAALITGTTFVSTGTGHAIEIGGTAANITLTGNIFTGYDTDDPGTAANKAIYVNIVSGEMIITVSGGSGLGQTAVRTAGCDVTVNSDVTVTFKGLKDNSEVWVLNHSDQTWIADIEDATTGTEDNRSFSFSAPQGTFVDYIIHCFQEGDEIYESIRVDNYEIPSQDTDINIQQRFDRNAEN